MIEPGSIHDFKCIILDDGTEMSPSLFQEITTSKEFRDDLREALDNQILEKLKKAKDDMEEFT